VLISSCSPLCFWHVEDENGIENNETTVGARVNESLSAISPNRVYCYCVDTSLSCVFFDGKQADWISTIGDKLILSDRGRGDGFVCLDQFVKQRSQNFTITFVFVYDLLTVAAAWVGVM
jgi:hypothetical protein